MGNKSAKNVKESQSEPKHQEAWQSAPSKNFVVFIPSGDENKNISLNKIEKRDLSEADYQFLTSHTNFSRSNIKSIFEKVVSNEKQLDKREFVELYSKLRSESPELLKKISDFVFHAFNKDQNGTLSFNEFMIAYALTSRGDQRTKLDYAFSLYDTDGNGYLDSNDIQAVIYGMLDLLGADRTQKSIQLLADECIKTFDTSKYIRVTKAEFIDGLMKNYGLQAIMSPFN
jgi:Ca2+-binding EF-hand superfamily protein